ncbi:ATP-binding cassette long-chain fatty acid transporter PXA2 ASCRUDRAFT_26032, partial [Ascoidea rubescens DSM 1968]
SFSKFYIKNRSLILKSSYILLLFATVNGDFKFGGSSSRNVPSNISESTNHRDTGLKQQLKRKITKNFFFDLIKLILPYHKNPAESRKIIFILISQIILLSSKIFLNLKVASLDGKLVSNLISNNFKNFIKLIFIWLVIGIPISLINSTLEYLSSNLSKLIKINLTSSLIEDSYFKRNNFYKIIHLDNRISDPHQRICNDIPKFAKSLSTLPTRLFNPSINLLICANQLANYGQNIGGAEGTLLLGLVVHFSTLFLKLVSPKFSKITAEQSQIESDFKTLHSKIINNNEQIAALRGYHKELSNLDLAYFRIENFLKSTFRKIAIYDLSKTFIIKYTWGALGLILCSFPIFFSKNINKKTISQDFIRNRRLLMSASVSLGQILSSKKYVDEVIGFSSRIIQFRQILNDLQEKDDGFPSTNNLNHNDNLISFKDVPLTTPTGQTLIPSLTFKIDHGDNLLILGPNGSGKSSLFRILNNLWPFTKGELIVPNYSLIFYLPQKPYLIKGKTSLKGQIIYPKTLMEFNDENKDLKIRTSTIDRIWNILNILELDDLVDDDAENSVSIDEFDLIKNWSEELSLGSQQKLAMARLYYHRPKFAVLDECTSQVTPEMETAMYEHATKALKISIISVAHRTSLWKFHNYLLQFNGDGTYIFKKFNYKKRLALQDEKFLIEKNLNNVGSLQSRMNELKIVKENEFIKQKSHSDLSSLS